MEAVLTKLGKMHLRVEGMNIYTNEGTFFSQKEKKRKHVFYVFNHCIVIIIALLYRSM